MTENKKSTPAKAAVPGYFIARLWSLCNVLRGDGVSYNQYISELTYLLFLKLAKETGSEALLPEGYRWNNLASYKGDNLLGYYQELLTHLGAAADTELVRSIYTFPTTVFSHSENLAAVIAGIDELSWHSLNSDAVGEVYEGLLAKNSEDTRSGAGQYFTHRALVDCMVACTMPGLGEIIQDPSAGTGGFLISADHYIRKAAQPSSYNENPPQYEGMEIERGTHRLCLMNVFLHGMEAKIHLGDTLTGDASKLNKAHVILANPPFGTRSGGLRLAREDLLHTSSNRQLQFLQHVYRALRPGGRAAVIVPDNVLFEGGLARKVRDELTELCDLHTILKLPTGIFYAQNVSTHVLFFRRGAADQGNTNGVWVYDLRTNMPRFGKRRQLIEDDFEPFVRAFGASAAGDSRRSESGDGSRFKRFDRSHVVDHAEEIITSWSNGKEQAAQERELDDADIVIQRMLFSLDWISTELRAVLETVVQPPPPSPDQDER